MVGDVRATGSDRVRLPGLLRFSTAAFASSGIVFALSIHIPRYFATHVGIGLAAVGLAFTVVRLLDIAVDPILGLVMDRTRTPLGRYRAWILMGTPILMLSSYMLFMAPPGEGVGYLIVWLLILYLAVSMITLALAAWAGTLSAGYAERARIFSLIGAVGILGSAAVMIVPTIVGTWRKNDDLYALHAMGWAMIVLLPLGAVLTSMTHEELRPSLVHQRAPLREYVQILWRPSMRRLVLAGLALALGPGVLASIFVFFWRDGRSVSLANTNILLVMYMAGAFIGAPLWGAIAGRFGKHRSIIASAVCFSIAQFIVVSLPKGSPLVFAGLFFIGLLFNAFTLLMQSIMADVSDEVRLEFGRERSGLLFAFTTTTQKVGSAVSIALTFWLLAWLGYDPGAGIRNTPAHLSGLVAVYSFAPIVFALLGGACFIGFPLNERRHAEIVAALAAREFEASVVVPGEVVPGEVMVNAT
jgi:GPH family glycoside/pentoside/hexuronide:cation symporter